MTEVEAEETNKAVNLKENLFIKQQENNFTENEIREHKKTAPHNLQQQRAQFLFGNAPSPTPINPFHAAITNNNKTAVFKSGHYTGIVTSATNKEPVKANVSNNNNVAASLETAL